MINGFECKVKNGGEEFLGQRAFREEEWGKLHDWAFSFRMKHKLEKGEFLVLCGVSDTQTGRSLLSRHGREQVPSTKENSVGASVFHALKSCSESPPEPPVTKKQSHFQELKFLFEANEAEFLQLGGVTCFFERGVDDSVAIQAVVQDGTAETFVKSIFRGLLRQKDSLRVAWAVNL